MELIENFEGCPDPRDNVAELDGDIDNPSEGVSDICGAVKAIDALSDGKTETRVDKEANNDKDTEADRKTNTEVLGSFEDSIKAPDDADWVVEEPIELEMETLDIAVEKRDGPIETFRDADDPADVEGVTEFEFITSNAFEFDALGVVEEPGDIVSDALTDWMVLGLVEKELLGLCDLDVLTEEAASEFGDIEDPRELDAKLLGDIVIEGDIGVLDSVIEGTLSGIGDAEKPKELDALTVWVSEITIAL